jgi:hypothetical protein
VDVALHHTVSILPFDRSVGARLVDFGIWILEAFKKRADVDIYKVVYYREDNAVYDSLFVQGSSRWNIEMDSGNKEHKQDSF